jgi:hypothetical protein
MMDGQVVRCGDAPGACVGGTHAVARLRTAGFFSLAGLALAGFARVGLVVVSVGEA